MAEAAGNAWKLRWAAASRMAFRCLQTTALRSGTRLASTNRNRSASRRMNYDAYTYSDNILSHLSVRTTHQPTTSPDQSDVQSCRPLLALKTTDPRFCEVNKAPTND